MELGLKRGTVRIDKYNPEWKNEYLKEEKILKEKLKDYDVNQGITKVYAENALNDILHKLSIVGMSYKDDYIEEIDNQEDYDRVNKEIELFDIK